MLGVPSIVAEDGGAGQYDSAIAERMLRGVENVLCGLEVIEGPVRNVPPPRKFSKFAWIRSRDQGFFRPEVKVGDEVAAGQKLGSLVDFYGRVVEEVMTADRGQILFMVISPAIGRSGLICGVGVE